MQSVQGGLLSYAERPGRLAELCPWPGLRSVRFPTVSRIRFPTRL